MRCSWRLAIASVGGALLIAVTSLSVVAASLTTATPRCDGVKLRSGPSTSAAIRTAISRGTVVTYDATVPGSAWSTLCGGKVISGSSWARVIAVDGVTVESSYGVAALYAAAGLLAPIEGSPTPTPTRTPRPSASPTPTPAPTDTPAPTAAPTSSPVIAASAAPSQAAGSPRPSGSGGPPSPFGGTDQWPPTRGVLLVSILVLAVASTGLAAYAVIDRRRWAPKPLPMSDLSELSDVPASRLEDVMR